MVDESSARIATARQELAETLDAIGDKFNPRKQAEHLSTRVKESWERHPIPWIIGGGIAAVLVAGAVALAFLTDD